MLLVFYVLIICPMSVIYGTAGHFLTKMIVYQFLMRISSKKREALAPREERKRDQTTVNIQQMHIEIEI